VDGSRVAIFIDDPNFQATTERLGVRINWIELLKSLNKEGHFQTIKKMYIDHNPTLPPRENKYLDFMKILGFEIIPVPLKIYGYNGQKDGKRYKSLTDSWIMVDIMEHLVRDDFDTLYLLSGDSDYYRVVSKVKKYGKRAIIVGSKRTLADNFQTIGEVLLLEDLDPTLLFALPRPSY
jgi:uncharacterized LabA/DUF88 family protein